jgi:hypothetical protein
MNTIMTSLMVAVCIFASELAGLCLNRLLTKHHLTKATQDVIKLGIGMLSVLASLVLGRLIATAKTSYDSTDRAIRGYAAELALLNETLRDYGGDASIPHDLLRSYTESLLQDGWPQGGARPAMLEDEEARLLLEHVREAIRRGACWLPLHPAGAVEAAEAAFVARLSGLCVIGNCFA